MKNTHMASMGIDICSNSGKVKFILLFFAEVYNGKFWYRLQLKLTLIVI